MTISIPSVSRKGWAKKLGQRSFLLWILYQTVKGTLTTTLIWVPLLYHYFGG